MISQDFVNEHLFVDTNESTHMPDILPVSALFSRTRKDGITSLMISQTLIVQTHSSSSESSERSSGIVFSLHPPNTYKLPRFPHYLLTYEQLSAYVFRMLFHVSIHVHCACRVARVLPHNSNRLGKNRTCLKVILQTLKGGTSISTCNLTLR